MLPKLTTADVSDLLQDKYGISCHLKQLGGYSDLNYLVTSSTHPHKQYVFKISSTAENYHLIRIQTFVLSKISSLS